MSKRIKVRQAKPRREFTVPAGVHQLIFSTPVTLARSVGGYAEIRTDHTWIGISGSTDAPRATVTSIVRFAEDTTVRVGPFGVGSAFQVVSVG